MRIKELFIIIVTLALPWIFQSGCAKEYSFEGGDSVVVVGSVIPPKPWICPACIGQDEQIEKKWSFHYENSLVCGIIDTAIMNPERTAFTFFGPSACSKDTGIIISAYFNENPFNKDLFNVTTERGAFYYYDNDSLTHILVSRAGNFTITIDSYIHQTRLVSGTFSGTSYKTNGGASIVNSGKFKTRLY